MPFSDTPEPPASPRDLTTGANPMDPVSKDRMASSWEEAMWNGGFGIIVEDVAAVLKNQRKDLSEEETTALLDLLEALIQADKTSAEAYAALKQFKDPKVKMEPVNATAIKAGLDAMRSFFSAARA
jgi:hypothetical protein